MSRLLERDTIEWNGRTLKTETIDTAADVRTIKGRTWGIADAERDTGITVFCASDGYCIAEINRDGMLGKAEGSAVTYDGVLGALDEALRDWRRHSDAWGK